MKFWHFAPLVAVSLVCLAPDCGELPGTDADAATDSGNAATSERARYASSECEKRGACITQNGGAFSQTECENANRIEGEKADSRECGESYDTYLTCAASIEYDCSQPIDVQLNVNCQHLYTAFMNCMNR